MGEFVVASIKWTIRLTVAMFALTLLVTLLAIIYQMLFVQLNDNVLADLVALVQMWLPFDISVIIMWFTSVGLMYVLYRLSIWALNFINDIVGTS